MESVADRPSDLARARAEMLLCALVAATASVAVVAVSPPGGDTAAHLYRTWLLERGQAVWDHLWFTGHYLLAGYSLLYYPPAALVGNIPLVVAAVVASAALFWAIAREEWGDEARWPARVFAVAAATPLFTGTYSYAVGFAVALGALRLVQLRRPWLAGLCAAIALGLSPLAFVLLGLALAAIVVVRRRLDRATVVLAAALGIAATLQLAIVLLFPTGTRYPYNPLSLLGVLVVTALTLPIALRAPRAHVLAAFFAVWALANVAVFVLPTPFGDNMSRLRYVLFPLVLLVVVVAKPRSRTLAAAALAAALIHNVAPDLAAVPKRVADARTAKQAFWDPALDYVRSHGNPGDRVEVVPTFGHWEAWFVARAGFPLARGWYRQIDVVENPELYQLPLQPTAYRAWLRERGVRWVLLPHVRLGPLGAAQEGDLLESGRSGLRLVYRSPDWRVYRVPFAAPLLSGPGRARVEQLGHRRLVASVDAPGRYRLLLRYTPVWSAQGAVCASRAADGMTRLDATRAGKFTLLVPHIETAVRRAFHRPARVCGDDV